MFTIKKQHTGIVLAFATLWGMAGIASTAQAQRPQPVRPLPTPHPGRSFGSYSGASQRSQGQKKSRLTTTSTSGPNRHMDTKTRVKRSAGLGPAGATESRAIGKSTAPPLRGPRELPASPAVSPGARGSGNSNRVFMPTTAADLELDRWVSRMDKVGRALRHLPWWGMDLPRWWVNAFPVGVAVPAGPSAASAPAVSSDPGVDSDGSDGDGSN
jgi:hypothetical protein